MVKNDFSEEILADLIDEGYEGKELLEKFKVRKNLLEFAVEKMVEDTLNQKTYHSFEEMLDDE